MSTTRAVTALAEVIFAAQQQKKTAMGVALTVDAAQMLMSPETASELEQLRSRVAELELQVGAAAEQRHLLEPQDRFLTDGVARLRAELETPADAPYVSRALPPRDATCARCGHLGGKHHHAAAVCWAHLPKQSDAQVRICGCSEFTADTAPGGGS